MILAWQNVNHVKTEFVNPSLLNRSSFFALAFCLIIINRRLPRTLFASSHLVINMKFSTAVFLAIALRTSIAFAAPDMDGEAPSKTPVGIKVTCDGVDFTKLSVFDNTSAGHILEDSYNSVHTMADNDDSALDGLTFRGSGMLGDYSEEEESLEWRRKTPKTPPGKSLALIDHSDQ